MQNTYFYFGEELKVWANECINSGTIKDIWKGFCAHSGRLTIDREKEFIFHTLKAEEPDLPEGKEFSVRVKEDGIFVKAGSRKGLIHGVMALMMRIEPYYERNDHIAFRIKCCEFESNYVIANRMIHICVFPETTSVFLRRCIRLAGVMQYTHVILEFWGTLQYECLRELSWENAFTKERVKTINAEILALGMEVIPMMNHLGHAAGCRVSGGKHVVLDQNPRLAPLFSLDGWSWNIESEQTREVLRNVRKELYDIFPEAGYFHLGCDEAYSYEKNENDQVLMGKYLRNIIEEVKSEGKRPIIWGDMLLNRAACGVGDGYFCSCGTPEDAERIIHEIPKDTIIADWHYDVHEAPIKTSLYFKDHGFEVIGTTWLDPENCRAHVKTICDNNLMGIMVTTWHTLAEKLPGIIAEAVMCGAYHSPWSSSDKSKIWTEAAALLRKVYFIDGNYRETGWTNSQVFLQARPMV